MNEDLSVEVSMDGDASSPALPDFGPLWRLLLLPPLLYRKCYGWYSLELAYVRNIQFRSQEVKIQSFGGFLLLT